MSISSKEPGFLFTHARLAFAMAIVGAIGIFYVVASEVFQVKSDSRSAVVIAQEAKAHSIQVLEITNQNQTELTRQIEKLSDTIQDFALTLVEVQTLQKAERANMPSKLR